MGQKGKVEGLQVKRGKWKVHRSKGQSGRFMGQKGKVEGLQVKRGKWKVHRSKGEIERFASQERNRNL